MIILYFSSNLHTVDEVVLPTGEGPSGQQNYLLDQSGSKSPQGPRGDGPSGDDDNANLVPPIQSTIAPAEATSLPVRSVSQKILQSPNVLTPEKQLSASSSDLAKVTPKTPRPIPPFAPVVMDPSLLLSSAQCSLVKRRLLNSPFKPSLDRSPGKTVVHVLAPELPQFYPSNFLLSSR